MTGKAVTSYATPLDVVRTINDTQEGSPLLMHNTEVYTPMQVATTVTFMVGIIQVISEPCVRLKLIFSQEYKCGLYL